MTETAVVPPALDGERVDRAVAMLWDLSRSMSADLIKAGEVLVDGLICATRSRRVAEGERLQVSIPEVVVPRPDPDPSIEVNEIWVDDDVIVIDKPVGLIVHPGAGHPDATLVNGLLARWPEVAGVGQPARPGIVHRLDAGTSGLLVVARTGRAYESLIGQLADHSAARTYEAIVIGHLASPAGLIDAPLGRDRRNPTRMSVRRDGKEARTRYERIELLSGLFPATHLRCHLETGRTHQIRVHLRSIEHPVVGDDQYGGRRPAAGVDRPMLHAAELSFAHPATGERVSFQSPLTDDFVAALERLRGAGI